MTVTLVDLIEPFGSVVSEVYQIPLAPYCPDKLRISCVCVLKEQVFAKVQNVSVTITALWWCQRNRGEQSIRIIRAIENRRRTDSVGGGHRCVGADLLSR